MPLPSAALSVADSDGVSDGDALGVASGSGACSGPTRMTVSIGSLVTVLLVSVSLSALPSTYVTL